MARSSTSTIFEVIDREIEISQGQNNLFTVRIRTKGGWQVVKTGLGAKTAAWLALRAAKGLSRKYLESSAVAGRIQVILYGFPAKGTGAEWIALRALTGPRPILLKAPALFRHRVIHIESAGMEGRFRMRIVDPFTDQMTAPVEVGQDLVDRAIKVFNRHEQDDQNNSHTLGQR